MIALLARVAVILCVAIPRAAATETWEQRLRRESIKVDGDEVTTMSVEALQAHIARHALDQEPREMSGPWVDDPAANDDDAKRMLDVDDAATTTSSRGPAPSRRRDAPRPVPTNSSNSVGSTTPGSIIPRPSTSRPRPCITASASDATSRSTRRC